jgi:hypothetical protein
MCLFYSYFIIQTILNAISVIQEFIFPNVYLMDMEPRDEHENQVKLDLQHLTRTLNAENLNAEIMFSPRRGIRSITPPFDSLPGNGTAVRERLGRIQPPPPE